MIKRIYHCSSTHLPNGIKKVRDSGYIYRKYIYIWQNYFFFGKRIITYGTRESYICMYLIDGYLTSYGTIEDLSAKQGPSKRKKRKKDEKKGAKMRKMKT